MTQNFEKNACQFSDSLIPYFEIFIEWSFRMFLTLPEVDLAFGFELLAEVRMPDDIGSLAVDTVELLVVMVVSVIVLGALNDLVVLLQLYLNQTQHSTACTIRQSMEVSVAALMEEAGQLTEVAMMMEVVTVPALAVVLVGPWAYN